MHKSILDKTIIDGFWNRDEKIINKINDEYGKYLLSIAHNIVNNWQTSEECLNDTFLALLNSIPPEKPKVFLAYAVKIIKNIAITRYRQDSADKRIPSNLILSLDELSFLHEDYELNDTSQYIKEAIDTYLKNTSEIHRYIFIEKYYLYQSVRKISSELNISVSQVYREISTIKIELKELIKKVGYSYGTNNN